MKRLIHIYSLYFLQSLKSRMAYPADFFVLMAASVMTIVSGLLFILFLIDGQNVESIGTWSKHEVLFIYGMAAVPASLFSFISRNLYGFGERWVVQGEFDRVLVRPLSSLFQVLFESFNFESLGSLFIAIGIVVYSSTGLNLSLDLFDFFWLAVSMISGAVIITCIFVCVTSLSFHFEDRVGLTPPVFNLMMFSRYPLPIFNTAVQFLLMWVLPFAFVGFFPATHFLSRSGFEIFCYGSPLMAVGCVIITNFLWSFGVSRYASVGN